MKKSISLFLVLSLASSSSVFAGGFEKSTMWSGRHAGMATASMTSVKGAEALYFNPAGLAGQSGGEVSLNFSPTWISGNAPIAFANNQHDAKTVMAPIVGILGSYGLTDKWGVGVGFYVSGGLATKYEGIDFTAQGFDELKGSEESDLQLTEIAVGTSYEVLSGLKLGLAWRAAMVKAEFTQVQNQGVLVEGRFTDLTTTRYNGWKVGLQYDSPEKDWGLGAAWRTEIGFIAKGTNSGQIEYPAVFAAAPPLAGTRSDLTGGAASVGGIFPHQVAFGGYYALNPAWTLYATWAWLQYAKNRSLDVVAASVAPHGTIITPDITTAWKNQHDLKVGLEHKLSDDMMIRGGYNYASQVSDERNAKPGFFPPAPGHIVALGVGKMFLENRLEGNLGAEYAWSKGTVAAGSGGIAGEYKVSGIAVHTGVNYRF